MTATGTLDTLHKVLIGVLIVGLLVGGYEGLQVHDEHLLMAQKTAAQQQLVSELAKQQAANDAATAAKLAEQQKQFDAEMKTYSGQVDYLKQYVASLQAGLKQPVTINVPVPTKDNPNPPVSVEVPAVDLPEIDAKLKDYRDLQIKYPACQADLATQTKEVAVLQGEVKTLKKGPGFWAHVKHDAKVVGVTLLVAAGVAAVVVAHK